MTAPPGADDWRYLRVGFAVVLVLVVAELAGWLVHRATHTAPTARALTEKCLRRQKLLRIEPVLDDLVARSAGGGALATRVEVNGVHVAFARPDAEAERLVARYLETAGRNVELRLDRRGRVVYLWEQAVAPTPTQRQTMYDCLYE